MKLLVPLFLLALALCGQESIDATAQSGIHRFSPEIRGEWTGTVVSHGQKVPIHLLLAGSPASLQASLLNGPEMAAASSVSFAGKHLLLTFNDYARTLDATLGADGKFTGSFGTSTVRYPVVLSAGAPAPPPPPGPRQSVTLNGDWEIAVHSVNGESAWQLHIDQDLQPALHTKIRAVIQRVDGDTGSLYGNCNAGDCEVSHLTPAGPALYRFKLQQSSSGEQTLLVSNMLHADLPKDPQQKLVAVRPLAARAANLPMPTDPAQQTTMKDPNARFVFSAPDLSGRVVSNTDPQFDGKVVIVSIGGSWCPNCHDEAPVLESLFKQFHARGLEIVNLSFEDDTEQLKSPTRLRSFIARYHLDYTVLLAGTTEQLNEKITQADHLDCWPTSFFVDRTGRVRRIHAGFAGPANPEAHTALVKEMTDLVSQLLEEPILSQPVTATIPGR